MYNKGKDLGALCLWHRDVMGHTTKYVGGPLLVRIWFKRKGELIRSNER
jgi:hypothetical protein